MAVAFDAQSFLDFTTTNSWTHTPVAAPRLAVVMIAQEVSSADRISGVTYGGQTMTRVNWAACDSAEPGATYIYWLRQPPSGAQTVSVTVSAGTEAKVGWAVTATASATVRLISWAQVHGVGAAATIADPTSTLGTKADFAGIVTNVLFSGAAAPATPVALNSATKLTGTDAGGKDFGLDVACASYNIQSGAGVTAGWTNAADDVAMASAAFDEEDGLGPDYRQTILGDGPVAYWRLAEGGGVNARDEKLVNPGTYTGGVTLGSSGLLVGDASTSCTFDGVDDRVQINDSATLDVTNISLEAWFAGTGGRLVSRQDVTGNYYLAAFNDGFVVFGLSIGAVGHDSFAGPTNHPSVIDGNVHHLVGTYDGANMRIYVDGAEVTGESVPLAQTGSIDATSLPIQIGVLRESGANSSQWAGRIGHAVLWDRALTAAEVLKHYRKGLGL